MEIDGDMALYLNHQQIAHSARYLYAAADSFNLARDFLKRHPGLRSVTTHLTMGELGRTPPRRTRMPAGAHLVVHGPVDHGMLEIQEIDEAGEGITARTGQIALLVQMAADPGMLRVELYIDGQPRRTLGDAMIEPFGSLADGWFRVVHRDPSLRELGKRLNNGRQ
jgi:hypothetical protein